MTVDNEETTFRSIVWGNGKIVQFIITLVINRDENAVTSRVSSSARRPAGARAWRGIVPLSIHVHRPAGGGMRRRRCVLRCGRVEPPQTEARTAAAAAFS